MKTSANSAGLKRPRDAALQHAEELLSDLGALEGTKISALGRRMLAFPVHPRYSRMLIAAQEYGCVNQACLVAALTQGRDLLLRNPDERGCDCTRGTDRRETLIGFLALDECLLDMLPRINFVSMRSGGSAFTASRRDRSGLCSNNFCESHTTRVLTSSNAGWMKKHSRSAS